MADCDSIDFLELRVKALEDRVYGTSEKDADYPKTSKDKEEIFESLAEIEKKIASSLAGKKKAALLYEKLPELKKYLDHAYTDDMMLSEDARVETVVAGAGFLEQQAALLEKLSDNQEHINSEHIQAAPKFTERLKTLSRVQIEQQDEFARLSEETRRLTTIYNNMVTYFSRQFVMWDETLSDLEKQEESKK